MRAALLVAAIGMAGCLTEFDPALLGGSGSGGGTTAPGASCREDDPLCGEVSCCDSLAIPGGTFSRGYDRSGSASQPGSDDLVTGFQAEGAAPATLSAFSLDRFEVTVARFRRFSDAYDAWRQDGHPAAGEGAHPAIAESGWDPAWPAAPDRESLIAAAACDTRATFDDGDERRPINCVSWYTAFMFCIWDGGRLPTEAEWAFAASGGDEQRAFPWSSPPESLEIDSLYAVYGDLPIDVAGSRAERDAGRFGHHDLAGNVREWVLDGAGSLETYPFSSDCVNCAAVIDGDRIHRGGDFGADAARARTAYRSADAPDWTSSYIGVRCAR